MTSSSKYARLRNRQASQVKNSDTNACISDTVRADQDKSLGISMLSEFFGRDGLQKGELRPSRKESSFTLRRYGCIESTIGSSGHPSADYTSMSSAMSHSLPTDYAGANPDKLVTTDSYIAEVFKGSGVSVCRVDGALGPIYAKRIVRLAATKRDRPGRLLLLTDNDIRLFPLQGLFGYADRRRGIAIISTARLRDPDNPARTRERLRNVAAHELGHLNGLSHCAGPQCVMTQVSTPEELDCRPLLPCERCPRRSAQLRQAMATIAALLFLAISVLAIERVTSFWQGAGPDFPFL